MNATSAGETAAWLANQEWDGVDLILMTGLGNSGALPGMVREFTTSPILVYEPRKEALKGYRVPVPRCLVSDSATTFRRRCRTYAENLDLDSNVLVLYDDEQDMAEVHADTQSIWDEALQGGYHKQAAMLGSSKGRVSGMLGSLDLFAAHKPINHCHNLMKGVPGLVVGAGPSLDKAAAAIQRIASRAVVAGVNTSLPALERLDVVPDFTVVCEAKPVGESTRCKAVEHTLMVPGLHVHRDTYDLPWKAIAPALSNEGSFGTWATETMGLPPAPIGGSSACLAAGVLYLMGCNPIILVGCDCAPQGGMLYSEGAAFAGTEVDTSSGAALVRKSEAKLAVEDVGPKDPVSAMPIVSTWNWDKTEKIDSLLLYDGLRQWFEEIAEMWKKDGVRLVNSSVGGAHILNWEHIELNAIADDLDPLPVNPQQTILDYLDTSPETIGDGLIVALDKQLQGADSVGSLAREGVRLMERAREIQEELNGLTGCELTDAWSWAEVERSRQSDRHRPVFEMFKSMFSEMERGSVELRERLTATQESLRNE